MLLASRMQHVVQHCYLAMHIDLQASAQGFVLHDMMKESSVHRQQAGLSIRLTETAAGCHLQPLAASQDTRASLRACSASSAGHG